MNEKIPRIQAIKKAYANKTQYKATHSIGELLRAEYVSTCESPEGVPDTLLDAPLDVLDMAAAIVNARSAPTGRERASVRAIKQKIGNAAIADFAAVVDEITKLSDSDREEALSAEAPCFDEVFELELDEIAHSRALRKVNGPLFAREAVDVSTGKSTRKRNEERAERAQERADAANLMGLAFSGGGIRAATICLGVLHGLAEMKLLPWFDYLSTVSGGGYMGAWFHAWVKRAGLADGRGLKYVAEQLSPARVPRDRAAEQSDTGEGASPNGENEHRWHGRHAIHFLRRYSNYLTPEMGFFSADTWTLVAIWIRNVLLNLGIVIPAICFLLIVPRLLERPFMLLSNDKNAALFAALLLLACGVFFIVANLRSFKCGSRLREHASTGTFASFYNSQAGIQLLIVVPMLLSSWVASAHMYGAGQTWQHTRIIGISLSIFLFAAGLSGGYVSCRLHEKGRYDSSARVTAYIMLAVTSIVSGLIGSLAYYVVANWIHSWRPGGAYRPAADFAALAWAPLLGGLTLFGIVILFLGLAGRAFPDDRREWWSRLGAWMAIYTIMWSGLMAISIYAPLVMWWLASEIGRWFVGTVTAGWIATNVWGLMRARSPATGEQQARSKQNSFLTVVPYIFIFGLLCLLSYILHTILFARACAGPGLSNACAVYDLGPFRYFDANVYWRLMGAVGSNWRFLLIVLGALAADVALLAAKVDINEFSMHHFYRNRLIRCYLGASNDRNPNSFTGLDFNDDWSLSLFRPHENGYDGPYPIINAAVNLSHGEDLAYQDRKASSFTFTPLYSGFTPYEERVDTTAKRAAARESAGGYRATERFAYPDGGPHLGTAMAISGAAASPNMGYHTSPALAFMMTVFDVRLGWWLGNPLWSKWRKSGPPFNLGYLVREMLGLTDAKAKYVYLSDGGHFENLALYELVRRRCRFIVCVDAEEDSKLAFEGLGTAIRKCRIDFDVEINLNVERIRTRNKEYRAEAHCSIGDIWYPPVTPGATQVRGTLVYIKSSLTGDEPSDILEYALRDSTFPHQATVDEFFDESQFESYRKLGYHMAMSTFGASAAGAQREGIPFDAESSFDDRVKFIVGLRQSWYPPSTAVAQSFTKLTEALDRFWERLRVDRNLHFLHPQLYPEWRHLLAAAKQGEVEPASISWLPANEDELTAGFYFCTELIQLIENAYVDLRLESEWCHPDNRGWMNLFHHCAWSGMFRATWAVTACTFGARFQRFCEDRLQLGIGTEPHGSINLKRVDAQNENVTLSRLERTLWKEFRSLYRDRDGVVLYSMWLSVKDPREFSGVRETFEFPFGVAALEGHALIAYRVRDHLRNMGLGRRGLDKLAAHPKTSADVRPPVRDVKLAPAAVLVRMQTLSKGSKLESDLGWIERQTKLAIEGAADATSP